MNLTRPMLHCFRCGAKRQHIKNRRSVLPEKPPVWQCRHCGSVSVKATKKLMRDAKRLAGCK